MGSSSKPRGERWAPTEGAKMSKVKSPQDKKSLNLKHDRRNAYGENDKASRKNIPLAKRRSNRAERRGVESLAAALTTVSSDDACAELEGKIKTQAKAQHARGFKKVPDISLGAQLEQKAVRSRRARNAR